MLIETEKERICINCGSETMILDTRTNMAVCNDDCRFDLWIENLYKNHDPIGEHNEYLFD